MPDSFNEKREIKIRYLHINDERPGREQSSISGNRYESTVKSNWSSRGVGQMGTWCFESTLRNGLSRAS